MDLNAIFALAEHLGRDPEVARAIQKAQRHAPKGAKNTSGEKIGGQFIADPTLPVSHAFRHDWRGAVEFLKEHNSGRAVAALHHPEVGDIDLIWGKTSYDERSKGFGLAKLIRWHPEVMQDLQKHISSLKVKQHHRDAIILANGNGGRASVRVTPPEYAGLGLDPETGHWLLTAYEIGA